MRTLIIAEAGVNHNGDVRLARRLIEVAAEAGADLVKFQTFDAQSLTTTQARKADYQLSSSDPGESQFEMLRKLELSPMMHRQLMDHAVSCGIEFFSTAFDQKSVDLLLELGFPRMKVPSGEITNLPYLRQVGAAGKYIILSTGMATLDEISAAIEALQAAGTPRDHITVLHCTTEYPAPMIDVNLRAMLTIRDRFGVRVGYSDHTQGIEVAIAAVALGATVIEKHFTLDRGLAGPDHKASLEPEELRAMVAAIRNIEVALGGGEKAPTASELRNLAIARKSLVAANAIKKGETFSTGNVTAKRPGTGISPMRWDEVIGRKASRDFARDELLDL